MTGCRNATDVCLDNSCEPPPVSDDPSLLATQIQLQAISNSQIKISWQHPDLSEDFVVKVEIQGGSFANYTQMGLKGKSENPSLTVGNLTSGVTYSFRLQTIAISDTSQLTTPVSLTL